MIRVKLIKNAQMPKQGRAGDAGYDLYLLEDVTFKKGVTVLDTGICVELPEKTAGLLAMRSSVCKTGLIIQQPLIDENYRGELHIIIVNPFRKKIKYNKGDRICSLYIFPVVHDNLLEAKELTISNRGTNWSGSSGK